MKHKMKVYHAMVNRVPAIQKKYHRLRNGQTSATQRLTAWNALIGMNLAYYLLGKKDFGQEESFNPDANKKIPTDRSESSLSLRESPEKLANKLLQYDVISFDVFDTLIFRPFSKPSDLFFLIGEKLRYLDFERIRIEMEEKARQDCFIKNGHREITLEIIYQYIEKYVGIPAQKGMEIELEIELELNFANPYFLEVFQHLKKSGKAIIATTDMYLPKAAIKAMVEKNRFLEIEEYFVSCEQGKSKSQGGLFQKVKEQYGSDKTYIHIGDNRTADILNARKAGWNTEYYKNVNLAGKPYRAEDMSVINGSMYRGIVNAHIHNGLRSYSMAYEYGFIYGGIFVLGYCQFIHDYVVKNQIDKILFLARDGDILNQVYQMLYPDEIIIEGHEYQQEDDSSKTIIGRYSRIIENGRELIWEQPLFEAEMGEVDRVGKSVPCEYVYWSRLAATKMSANYFKYDYFRRFLYHKVNQEIALKEIFSSMELEDMLNKLSIGKEKKLSHDTKLTDKNVEVIKEYLIENWEEVLAHYDQELEAGKQYYSQVLKGHKKVVAVDIGWAGSGAVALSHIVNDIWGLDCEVIGILAGTNTFHNAEVNASEPLLMSGQLVSYLYSQGHNRDIWKSHDPNKGQNLYMEILLSARDSSFQKFIKQPDNRVVIKCKICEEDKNYVEDIQKGIMTFISSIQNNGVKNADVENYKGKDVYQPFEIIGKIKNYMKQIEPQELKSDI